jgi:hypothetical protein
MKLFLIFLALPVFALSVTAQSTIKPWTDWSKKDAEKILNDSSWGQTFTDEPSGPVDTTVITNTRPGMSGDRKGENPAAPTPKPVHYRVRFLTAKPVREAFARVVSLSQPDAGKELTDQLQGFIDRDFGDYLVVSFSIESEDVRRAQGYMMVLSKLTIDSLRDKVYLERGDGKRATLIDYKPPMGDGMGGKFVFSRTLDGQQFLSDAQDTAKFVFQLSEKQKINLKFKVAGMTYGGKLEY